MNEVILDARDITYRYEKQNVLQNISFKLHRGEMLGMIGPNGSGKTTLLKILLGVLPLQKGEICWFGESIQQFKQRSKLSYVSQKANSFNSGFPVTVHEVVSMGLVGKTGMFRRLGLQDKNKINEVINQVGLAEFANKNIGRLSGGQQQRAFIARALVSEPEVIIFDEPTVGVDVESQQYLFQELQRSNQERDLSIILVSHDLAMVEKHMDTVICLNQLLHFVGSSQQFAYEKEEILTRLYRYRGEMILGGTAND